eukprot:11426754-Prorocentrum_lima.AAC.1
MQQTLENVREKSARSTLALPSSIPSGILALKLSRALGKIAALVHREDMQEGIAHPSGVAFLLLDDPVIDRCTGLSAR